MDRSLTICARPYSLLREQAPGGSELQPPKEGLGTRLGFRGAACHSVGGAVPAAVTAGECNKESGSKGVSPRKVAGQLRSVNAPYEAIATPTLTTSMLLNVPTLKVSVCMMQPTTKTATGISACTTAANALGAALPPLPARP